MIIISFFLFVSDVFIDSNNENKATFHCPKRNSDQIRCGSKVEIIFIHGNGKLEPDLTNICTHLTENHHKVVQAWTQSNFYQISKAVESMLFTTVLIIIEYHVYHN